VVSHADRKTVKIGDSADFIGVSITQHESHHTSFADR
jgi:hypothetical protein